MSVTLSLLIDREIPFPSLVNNARDVLHELLRPSNGVPQITAKLPPNPSVKGVDLATACLGPKFPGAYVGFERDAETLVDIGVVVSDDELPRPYFVGGRTAKANVLAACFAIGTARITGSVIWDGACHWMPRDEFGAEDLVQALKVEQAGLRFARAVVLAYRKQVQHE